MKDSWSHGDDRRDRGRVDRGVTHLRRSPSPTARRRDLDRHRETDRADDTVSRFERRQRSRGHSKDRDRDRGRARDHRRLNSKSPTREKQEDIRERNRGRELLDSRSSATLKRDNHHDLSVGKRHNIGSPSRDRDQRKRSKREASSSRDRYRSNSKSLSNRVENSRRDPSQTRNRSPRGRRTSPHTSEGNPSRFTGHEKRHLSRSPKRNRSISRGRRSPARERLDARENSPSDRGRDYRDRHHQRKSSPRRDFEGYKRARSRSRSRRRHSSRSGREAAPVRSKVNSCSTDRSSRSFKESAHKNRAISRERGSRAASRSDRISTSASAADKEAHKDKTADMNGPGGYGYGSGFQNPNQIHSAFSGKPQVNTGSVDPRHYSQSPQHLSAHSSYHGSPQHSPYGTGRGGYPQQQYSPQHQYAPNHTQGGFAPPGGPQGQYYPTHSHSPQYSAQNGQVQHQQNFRGGTRGGFRGAFRGRSHFQNLHWNAATHGSGRGQHGNSGNVTPQHTSPPGPPSQAPPPPPDESTPKIAEEEDLFRPSKDLQVEDTSRETDKDTAATPSGKPPSAGLQSSKFSFAFKASQKAPPTAPKPEISQKLDKIPARAPAKIDPAHNASRHIPTAPAASRRHDYRESRYGRDRDPRDSREPYMPREPRDFREPNPIREPPRSREAPSPRNPPAPRKVKKVVKRMKPKPILPAEFKTSDSVYYRKPGNESVVGSGTYGKVFKAIHVYTKKLVALKKIRMEGERDGFPVTAVREIKLLQSLKHPNIVNLQEVMVEKNDCFMVFEYLSHDLTGLLNHPSYKLNPAQKKDLAKQMFDGLDYLHRRGVLHRDIKAANILVSNEGQLKLADFGLARFYAKRRQLDYTNRVITIWYRSPELLLGETQYGPAVDIWSAACVLVEIFTRHAIFPGDGGEISQLDKIYAILGTPNVRDWPGLKDMQWFELLRPTARRPNVFAEKYKERVSPAAFELLEAMLQYDPLKRPSAADVLEHPYFTVEEPTPQQAIELQTLEGDWHEFESKALRKENEKRDKEARRAIQKEAAREKDRERKREVPDGDTSERESKRLMTAMPPPPLPEGEKENGQAFA